MIHLNKVFAVQIAALSFLMYAPKTFTCLGLLGFLSMKIMQKNGLTHLFGLKNIGIRWKKEIYLFNKAIIQTENFTFIPMLIHIHKHTNHIIVKSILSPLTIPLYPVEFGHKLEIKEEDKTIDFPYEPGTAFRLPQNQKLFLLKREKRGMSHCWKEIKIGQAWPNIISEGISPSSSEDSDSSDLSD